MMKFLIAIIMGTFLYANLTMAVYAEEVQKSTIQNQDDEAQFEALRRGSYRSPSGSFTGGNRTGGDGYSSGPRAPSSDVARNPRVQPAPQTPGSRWGGFLGGAAAGALIGHFLNPFGGFGYGGLGGGGFSLISVLIWAVIIYLGYKFFQKMFRRRF
jgi:predicted lipid-binding transport protein (Tim44 family)